LRAVNGKPDSKARFTGAGFKFNFAAMTVADNAVADDQTQAGSAADGFRGEKGLENVRLDSRGNAGTIVHNFDYQLVIFPAGADADLAGAIYSGYRIIN